MTLVISRIIEKSIHIHSDTRITSPNIFKNNPLAGLLKSVILHPFICLSFAGNVIPAQEAIASFFTNKISDLDSLLNMLLATHQKANQATDFGVASCINKQPRLFEIKNGTIVETSSFWLGDTDGFNHYQHEFHTMNKSLSTQIKMREAFKNTLDSSDIKTIGDFHISASLDFSICNPPHPVFLYDEKIEINVSEKQTISYAQGKRSVIPLGTTHGGSYGISYLTSVSPDFHGVGIHFTHGNFGIIYCPQINHTSATLIRNVSGAGFAEEAYRKYNIPLRGLVKKNATAVQYVDARSLII